MTLSPCFSSSVTWLAREFLQQSFKKKIIGMELGTSNWQGEALTLLGRWFKKKVQSDFEM